MGDDLNLTVRIMPAGEEHELELSRFTTGGEIIDALIENEIVSKSDHEGNPYIYRISTKGSGVQLTNEKTLHDVNVKDNDTLMVIPEMVAGFF